MKNQICAEIPTHTRNVLLNETYKMKILNYNTRQKTSTFCAYLYFFYINKLAFSRTIEARLLWEYIIIHQIKHETENHVHTINEVKSMFE